MTKPAGWLGQNAPVFLTAEERSKLMSGAKMDGTRATFGYDDPGGEQ
jgi:hypothetical protein